MKIIGTERELNWIEKELPKLEDCFLNAECVMVNLPYSVRVAMTDNEQKEICKKCIEKNVVFEIKERPKKKAIEALEQELCEDAISRESMLNYQQYLHGRMSNEENHKLWEFIKDLPSVTPVPKKCHNVNTDHAECDQFVCSNCGIELQDWNQVERDEDDGDITYREYEFNFCPNCGAKIESEE